MKEIKIIISSFVTIVVTGTIAYFATGYAIEKGYLKSSKNINKVKTEKPVKHITTNFRKPLDKSHEIKRPNRYINNSNRINSIDKDQQHIVHPINNVSSSNIKRIDTIKSFNVNKLPESQLSKNNITSQEIKKPNNIKKVNNENIYVLTSDANLREGPDYKTKKLGTIKEGNKVNVIGKDGKYYKTDKGYIYSKTLRKLYSVNSDHKFIIKNKTYCYKDKNLKLQDEKLYPGDEFKGTLEGNVVKIVKNGKSYYVSRNDTKEVGVYNNNIKLTSNSEIEMLKKELVNIKKTINKNLNNSIDNSKLTKIEKEISELKQLITSNNSSNKKLKRDVLVNNRNIKLLDKKLANFERMLKTYVGKIDQLSKLIKSDIKNNNSTIDLKSKREVELLKSEIGKLKEQYRILIERNKEFVKEIEKLINKKEINSTNGTISTLKAEPQLIKDKPFTYLGFSLNSDGEKEAYITVDGVDVYKVMKGNIINQRWEVRDIRNNDLMLYDNDSKKLVKLPLEKKK